MQALSQSSTTLTNLLSNRSTPRPSRQRGFSWTSMPWWLSPFSGWLPVISSLCSLSFCPAGAWSPSSHLRFRFKWKKLSAFLPHLSFQKSTELICWDRGCRVWWCTTFVQRLLDTAQFYRQWFDINITTGNDWHHDVLQTIVKQNYAIMSFPFHRDSSYLILEPKLSCSENTKSHFVQRFVCLF